MRTSSLLLSTVLCASSTVLVAGWLFAPCHDGPAALGTGAIASFAMGGDGEAELVSRAGQVLVAAPSLDDPWFAGTNIYLLADDEGGTLGVVLNRPHHRIEPGVTLWDGGPVGRDRIFVLHDELDDSRSVVVGDVAVAGEPSVLHDVLDGQGPARARIFVGYAGWGPGQLDREIAAGAWILAEPARGMILRP